MNGLKTPKIRRYEPACCTRAIAVLDISFVVHNFDPDVHYGKENKDKLVVGIKDGLVSSNVQSNTTNKGTYIICVCLRCSFGKTSFENTFKDG